MGLIYRLQGTVFQKGMNPLKDECFIGLDAGGVGYYVLTTERALQQCGALGEEACLHIAHIVRQDDAFLVGFFNREERDMFQVLLQASGVGPKVALAILSALSVSEVAHAILTQDYQTLTAAKGLGKRGAEKLVVELKQKMSQLKDKVAQSQAWEGLDAALSQVSGGQPLPQLPATANCQEAESVLLSLGYQPHEIRQSFQAMATHDAVIVQGGLNDCPSEVLLRECLRWLALQVG